MGKCDIIIPVWNELESTRQCIDKIKENTHYPYRLIVIDNGSLKPTSGYLESLKGVFSDFLLIRNEENLGFVKAINQGISKSRNPYSCIFNNDTYVGDNWLTFLIETVESGPKSIGIANPTSNTFGKDSTDGGRREWQELDSCRGFCMLIKREVIKKIGSFDEIFGMGYFEEKDFSRRAIKAGYICIRAKSSFVVHKDRLSFNKIEKRDEIFKKNEEIFNQKWGRPISIAFVVKQENELRNRKDVIYELLKEGHRINVFFAGGIFGGRYPAGLKDHIQIRFISARNPFFEFRVLFKLWERLRKKKVEIIVTGDKSMLNFFNRFRFIHKSDVLDENVDGIKSFCTAKSKGV